MGGFFIKEDNSVPGDQRQIEGEERKENKRNTKGKS